MAIGSDPEMRAKIHAMGCEPTGTTSDELKHIQRAEFERWGPIVKASGFPIEG
jgi:tripartite-type tricarboxylate transporter receptor subunit TctC